MTTKIQNEDVKSLSDVTGAGGTAANLIHDDKLYNVQYAEQLSTALGTVLLSYSSKTANFTAANASVYYVNSTSAGFNLQLPPPVQGLYFYVIDVAGQISVNNVTVLQHASEKIGGLAASYLLNLNYNIWYFSSDGTDWYVSSGAGSGSGGSSLGVNFIGNPGAELSTSGWSTYSNTAQNIPVNGTGGTATGLTFSRTTTSPLDGVGSFSMVQANSTSLQGKGVSTPFTIDNAYKAKPLAVQFNFNASSTFVAANGITPPLNDGTTSTNAGNSDIEVFIYDVTNAVIIPVSPQVITANGANNFTFNGKFQTNSNSTSYRLIFHVATANANATGWSFLFDQVYVGPQIVNIGSPMTDWVTYTPTTSWVSNANPSGQWRRIGDSMQVQARVNLSGAPTATEFTVSIPSGFTIDTTKVISGSTTDYSPLGSGWAWHNSASSDWVLSCNYHNTTSVTATGYNGSSRVNATFPFTFANGDEVQVIFTVPIVGWASTIQMSNDTDTRVVAFNSNSSLTNNGSTSVPTGTFTKAVFTTFSQDTHGAYNTSTGTYTIPVSGYYFISAEASFPSMAVGQRRIDIYQNGSSIEDVNNWDTDTSNPATPKASVLAFCKAGDTINVYYYTTTITGSPFTVGNNIFQLFRLSGPASIATTESVNMKWNTASAPSIPGTGVDTIVKLDTKVFDSHNAYSSSTGLYTVPISGIYMVMLGFGFASHSWTQGNNAYGELFKNGALDTYVPNNSAQATGSYAIYPYGTTLVKCLAGDTLAAYLNQNSGTACLLNANGNDNYMCITRVGN